MQDSGQKYTIGLISLFLFLSPLCLPAETQKSADQHLGPIWTPRVKIAQAPRQKSDIDWNREIIYFILIDRFFNGDTTNDSGRNPTSHVLFNPEKKNYGALKTYQGGDLQGVIDKLDYLQQLGVTAIWLSPVFDNSDTDFQGWWPYHGYHPIDFFSVDEHFGTMETLKELVKKAHQRGMKIILDMVFNHVAPDHPWVVRKELWEDMGYKHWFHPHSGVDASTSIQDWQDQDQLENREVKGLPDLAQENPHVYDFLLDVAKYWIVQTNCDGYRLDAVKHIPKNFWRKICRDIHAFAGKNFLMLGEVFEGNTNYVAGYDDVGFNALFDIPMYFTIKRVFAQGGNVNLLSKQIAQNKTAYSHCILSTLIDNHDVARFSYWAGSDVEDKIQLALSFALTLNGLPMIYYGTEVALKGAAPNNPDTGQGQDYLNRLMMPWSEVLGSHRELVQHIKKILWLRRHHLAMQRGRLIEIYKDYGIYAYVRTVEDDVLLIIINTSTFQEDRVFYLRDRIFPASGIFRDLLTGENFPYRNDSLKIKLQPQTVYFLQYPGRLNAGRIRNVQEQCDFSPVLTRDFKLIHFSFHGDDSIRSVAVAGDFNGWSASENPMRKNSESGLWQLQLPLRSGRYRYKFVINHSRWIADPNASHYELDPFGGKNSVLIVR